MWANSFDVDGQTDLEIWAINADGTGRGQLTNNSFPDTQPAWSPVGDMLAFVSARTGDTDRNVYVMNSNGSGQISITPNSPPGCSPNCYQGHEDNPAWAPDGSKIAYVHGHTLSGGGRPDIWTMNPSGGAKLNLTDNDSTSDVEPAWSPNGGRIAYKGVAADLNHNMYVMNANGTGQGPIDINAAKDEKPDWQPIPVCTLTGTPGNDSLVGTPDKDVICGLGGNDRVNGRGGDDELLGGDGDDVLVGRTGDDLLDGGAGSDTANFANGSTTGGVDADLSFGSVTSANLGTDTIAQDAAGSTVEHVDGTKFADTLQGDGQDNELKGNAGADTLVGGAGEDRLRGIGGTDTLEGGDGDDTLLPGAGDDPMVAGGAGSDTVSYHDIRGGGVTVDLATGTASALGGSNAGNDTLGGDVENAAGTPAADDLSAVIAGTASLLWGGGGADSLDALDGDSLDVLRGRSGADSCTADPGDATFSC